MPAVAVAVVSPDRVEMHGAWGLANVPTGEPVTLDHSWDLASLTKALVTLPEVLALVDEGVLSLDAPLGVQWAPSALWAVGAASLAQVLSYNAGLPASGEFFRLSYGSRQELVDNILRTERNQPPGAGAVYSDIGAIALGELVADRRGRPLDALALDRSGLEFTPMNGPFVATEDCPWRGRLLQGEVHDENACALGGVAGHAGAFGRIDQVAEQARRWLSGEVVSPDLHSLAVEQWATNEDGERFGLGWWLANTRGLGGRSPGADSWGMSGFVGNRIWMEPARGYGVVVLSNRVHPSRGDRGPYNQWCDELLDIVASRA
jgi:CubicO group peptidase (beta-lactamase class C family)